MTTLAKASSFTWNNDFDLQNLKIAIGEMSEDNEYRCPMWKLTIDDQESGDHMRYEMGIRDLETMHEVLTKLLDNSF